LNHRERSVVSVRVGMEIASLPLCGDSRAAGQIEMFLVCSCCQALCLFIYNDCIILLDSRVSFRSQLSATDVSARTTMKGAAKCDKHCELQNSVNQSGFERILCFWDIPESMPASVSISSHSSTWHLSVLACNCVSGCREPLACVSHRSRFHTQQTQSADWVPHVVLSVGWCLILAVETKLPQYMKLGQQTR